MYEFIIDYSTLILAIISLCCTLISVLTDKLKIIIGIVSLSTIAVGIIISFRFILVFLYWQPLSILPLVGIVGTLIMYSLKNISKRFLKIYSLLQYVLTMTLLLLAIELTKASYNTWGSGSIYFGIFMLTFLIPLRHLTRELYERHFTYGILELLSGLISISLILVLGFSTSEFNTESVFIIRKGLILLSVSLLLEGILLIYKGYRKGKNSINLVHQE